MTERYRIWKDEMDLEMQKAKLECIELEHDIATCLNDVENYLLAESVRHEAHGEVTELLKKRNTLMNKISEYGLDKQTILVRR